MLSRFRLTELVLLIPAALVVLSGLALVSLAFTGKMSLSALQPGLVYAGALVVTYAVLVAARFAGDQVLLPIAAVLAALGLVLVQRLAPALAGRQLAWVLLGLALCLGIALGLRDLGILKRYRYLWALAGLGLVAATFFLGVDVGGSGDRLWLGIGPLVFQPSELLKVFLVIFLASYLEERRELLARAVYRLGPLRLPPLPYLGPLAVMWGISLALLVAQRDLGAALLFFGIYLAMLFMASGKASYVLAGLGLFLAGSWVTWRLFPHVQARVSVWLNPWAQAASSGYQTVQGLLAFASGGILGVGLGYGYPGYIPAVHTDFVLAAIGEEMGLAGALAVLVLYLLLVYRGFHVALRAHDPFAQLLAAGLTATLALQTLIIVAGNLKVIPLTGITLPFVSYGGSSLVTNFVIIGLLLRISYVAGVTRVPGVTRGLR
jgi:cell division protein FtsW (lipid II flippase)